MGRKRTRQSSMPKTVLAVLATMLSLALIGGMGNAGNGMATIAQAGMPTGNVPASTTARAQVLILHVYFRNTAERDQLANEFDAEEMPTTSGYLTILGNQSVFDQLSARGLRVEINRQATDEINAGYNGPTPPNTFYGGYKTVEEMQTLLDQYASTYPTLAQMVHVGASWCKQHAPCSISNPALTWNGYDQLALHITNQAIPGPKPVYWYEAAIHSREIATPEIAYRYIQWLLDGYNSDPDAHWLVDYQDIWVMPMTNPDGHHMVEYGGNSPIYQRKNANYTNGCTVWGGSGSQLGTDNNRNFIFQWGCCGGSSGSSCDQTYRGPSAGSDPESTNVINQVRLLIPDQRGPNPTDPAPITATGVFQDMHSNAALNLFAWGFQVTPHSPNDAELRNIGHHMQAANAFPSGNSYQTGQPPELLYAVDGDTVDWAYGELGAAAYTTEVGGSGFFPSYSTIDSSLWPLNKGALIYQAKVARTPYLLSHGPDTTLTTTTPMTVTQGTPSQLSATINFAWSSNAFAQNVGAAEYYVDSPPWAGGTATPMSGTYGGSQTVPVQATIDTGSLAPGRHLIYVRGRGVNQVQGLDTWGPISAAWLWILPAGSVTPTATSQATNTPQPTSTNTVAPSATRTSTPLSTNTSGIPSPTDTTAPTATTHPSNTVLVASPTNTPVVPTITPGGPTFTPVVPTDTPTDTATVPPGSSPTATDTVVSTTATSEATATPGQPTATSQATVTSCTVEFPDVPPGSTFYDYVHCLACRGVITGYPNGTFGPNNPVTRGQLSKIVSNSAGFTDEPTTNTFEDVQAGSTFFTYVERLYLHAAIQGYPCGGPGEPCVPPANKPYFRPNANVTRGQTSKIVAVARQLPPPSPGQQTFEDVPEGSPFWTWIEALATTGAIQGYPCGGPGEPCVPPSNKPYFRPSANVTRGEAAKIVSNAFFPGCVTARK